MEPRNVCAGPFGAVYDCYIERPCLAWLVLGGMWGVDPRPFYRSLAAVGEMPDGATILDVPCGGGIALRVSYDNFLLSYDRIIDHQRGFAVASQQPDLGSAW